MTCKECTNHCHHIISLLQEKTVIMRAYACEGGEVCDGSLRRRLDEYYSSEVKKERARLAQVVERS